MTAAHPVPLASLRSRRLRQLSVSSLLGLGFTLVLFLSIAYFERIRPPAPAVEYDDLRAVSPPLEPPPPPRVIPVETAAPIAATGLEATPSDSPVKIAVTPPDLDALLPPPDAAPPAQIEVGKLYSEFKPRIDVSGGDLRIYQTNEVDQLPQVLYRVDPVIPASVRGGVSSFRVVLMVLIDGTGAITSVRVAAPSGNPEYDAIVAQNVRLGWTFSAAVRRGKKVKCLLEQKVIVRWKSPSPFES
jgi:hypothetical protein